MSWIFTAKLTAEKSMNHTTTISFHIPPITKVFYDNTKYNGEIPYKAITNTWNQDKRELILIFYRNGTKMDSTPEEMEYFNLHIRPIIDGKNGKYLLEDIRPKIENKEVLSLDELMLESDCTGIEASIMRHLCGTINYPINKLIKKVKEMKLSPSETKYKILITHSQDLEDNLKVDISYIK